MSFSCGNICFAMKSLRCYFFKMIRKKIVVIIYSMILFMGLALRSYGVVDDISSSGSWNAPGGATVVTVYVWGGGGGGGGAEFGGPAGKAGGGGGGAYALKVFTVNFGETYTITVGLGGGGGPGTGGPGGFGGASSFSGLAGTVTADGGTGGGGSIAGNPGLGGAGGVGGTGDTNFAGGAGADGASGSGGGGGGAGTAGIGGDASGANGGSGTSLWGGDGANGLNVEGPGTPGSLRGGGGSGGHCITADQPGGAGADGFVRIVYDLAPIVMTKNRDLIFGSFSVGPAAGTLTVDPVAAGSISSTGDVFVVGASTHQSAKFSLVGAPAHFVAELDNPPSALTGPGSIDVTFTLGYDPTSADGAEIYVGGTLNLIGSEVAGTYFANNVTLTIDYD